MSEEQKAKLAAKHDELIDEYNQADDEAEANQILEQIGLIEYALFYGV